MSGLKFGLTIWSLAVLLAFESIGLSVNQGEIKNKLNRPKRNKPNQKERAQGTGEHPQSPRGPGKN